MVLLEENRVQTEMKEIQIEKRFAETCLKFNRIVGNNKEGQKKKNKRASLIKSLAGNQGVCAVLTLVLPPPIN